VCELYLSVVGEYHRDALAQLPFHAAVAHNNGMFVAHSLLTLATSHLIKVRSSLLSSQQQQPPPPPQRPPRADDPLIGGR